MSRQEMSRQEIYNRKRFENALDKFTNENNRSGCATLRSAVNHMKSETQINNAAVILNEYLQSDAVTTHMKQNVIAALKSISISVQLPAQYFSLCEQVLKKNFPPALSSRRVSREKLLASFPGRLAKEGQAVQDLQKLIENRSKGLLHAKGDSKDSKKNWLLAASTLIGWANATNSKSFFLPLKLLCDSLVIWEGRKSREIVIQLYRSNPDLLLALPAGSPECERVSAEEEREVVAQVLSAEDAYFLDNVEGGPVIPTACMSQPPEGSLVPVAICIEDADSIRRLLSAFIQLDLSAGAIEGFLTKALIGLCRESSNPAETVLLIQRLSCAASNGMPTEAVKNAVSTVSLFFNRSRQLSAPAVQHLRADQEAPAEDPQAFNS